MKKEEFINESGLEFTDISSEDGRFYHFPNGSGLTIVKPYFLNVSASGGHRIIGSEGISYYINPSEGWYISWTAKKGQPHFVK